LKNKTGEYDKTVIGQNYPEEKQLMTLSNNMTHNSQRVTTNDSRSSTQSQTERLVSVLIM